jgi:hypothetical protein
VGISGLTGSICGFNVGITVGSCVLTVYLSFHLVCVSSLWVCVCSLWVLVYSLWVFVGSLWVFVGSVSIYGFTVGICVHFGYLKQCGRS